MTAANPLLQDFDLPPYSQIKPEHVEPAIDSILADSRVAIAELLKTQQASPSWDGLVLALDELNARLGRAWGPVSHLNAVCNNAELRAAYEACLPKLSEYWTEMGQNKPLFEAYDALAKSPAAAGFDVAQKTILDHALRDFRLSGIDLPAEQQKRYGEIQMKLSELASRFSNQLLDATQAWTKHITDETALAGLTDSAKAQMAQAAQAKELDGWLITLEFPSYYAVMTYADDRALRRLQVDYLDLYYCHRPDPDTPVEETVWAMDSLIRQGKFRAIEAQQSLSALVADALRAYLAAPEEGYYLKSPKSFLGATGLSPQQIQLFADIVAAMMVTIKQRAEGFLGAEIQQAVIGQPVNFQGLGGEESNLQARQILTQAARLAGFTDIAFQYEPVAAGLEYEASLQQEQRVLVLDIGGGTTDCSFLLMGPERAASRDRSADLLGHTGQRLGRRQAE